MDLLDAYLLIALATSQAALLGAAVFAAAVLPALTVRHLALSDAAVFLRAFWPVYYRAFSLWAALNALALALFLSRLLPLGLAVLLGATASLAALCFFAPIAMIPTMNRIADAQGMDAEAFGSRHRRVVQLTGVALLATAATLAGTAWVLPGHFTVWMMH
jgi:hypothetical protein